MKRIKSGGFAALVIMGLVFVATQSQARIIYSSGNGNWTATGSWVQGVVPVAGDTVVIKSGHTISVTANLYSNSTYMFLVIVGTLDLTNNGKLSFSASSKVIIETNGRILGDGNSDQISIGSGGSEYRGGVQGNITGPSYVSNGHSPTTGEGTGGCGCYTPGTIPLPVKLSSFSASIENNMVTLKWITIMEKNFREFLIERSANGVDFFVIGSENGAGYNVENIETKYTFIDNAPVTGYNYYRLKAVDLDNTSEYFGVVTVQVKSAKHVSAYPNPTDGNAIRVSTNFSPSDSDVVQVFDNLGVKLYEFSVASLDNTLVFNNTLTPGTYLLKYVSPGHQEVVRFTVK